MKTRTTVRLTVTSPLFGVFAKAIDVANDVPSEEQELIDSVSEICCA